VPERSEIALVAPDRVLVRLWHQLVERQGDYVTFDQYHSFEVCAAPVVSRSCLRFSMMGQIKTLATAARLRFDRVVDDWQGEAFAGTEPEIIAHLQVV
jgi:hypothetical protein